MWPDTNAIWMKMLYSDEEAIAYIEHFCLEPPNLILSNVSNGQLSIRNGSQGRI